jgi:hypothetical protein
MGKRRPLATEMDFGNSRESYGISEHDAGLLYGDCIEDITHYFPRATLDALAGACCTSSQRAIRHGQGVVVHHSGLHAAGTRAIGALPKSTRTSLLARRGLLLVPM